MPADLRSHTHCPGCGLHYRSVSKIVEVDKATGTWSCSTCVVQSSTAKKGNLVLITCPDCNNVGDSMLPCGGCAGLGSVYVPESNLKVYTAPAQRPLTDEASTTRPTLTEG